MIAKYLQIAALVIIGIVLIFFSQVPVLQPALKTTNIIGLLVEFIAFMFWYFDERLSLVTEEFRRELKGHLTEMSLPDALSSVAGRRKHWKAVRIMATSTGQIQPLFSSCGFTADEVKLVLRSVSETDANANPRLMEFRDHTKNIIGMWQDLNDKGRIRALSVSEFEFFPLEYQVIFDETILVLGLYTPDTARYSQVYVENPSILTSDTSAGSREIKKYVSRFDGLVKHVKVLSEGPSPT